MEESKQLQIYKRLLDVFGEYVDSYPVTGYDRTFEALLDVGLESVPEDKKALDILDYVLYVNESAPAVIQKLMNVRFADLPLKVRPLYHDGRKRKVAFWWKEGEFHDVVRALLNLEGEPEGAWCSSDGEEVELVDFVSGSLT